jgi:hypothetical protein
MVRLPVEEKGGSYGVAPGFKDAERGDISIPNRQVNDAGARAERASKDGDER